nr:MAG TPA: hypothetical protein [Caudoviricetes sp.]
MNNVFPFVKEPLELNKMKSCKAYILREKVNNGDKLDFQEKEWITEKVNTCSYSKTGIAVMGWIFDFADILKRYVYKRYNSWTEAYAFNKTCLRKTTYGRIDEIVELP